MYLVLKERRLRAFKNVNVSRVILHSLLSTNYYELRSSAQYDYKQDLIVWHTLDGTIEALRYKPRGRGFDFRLGHCNFVLTYPIGRLSL